VRVAIAACDDAIEFAALHEDHFPRQAAVAENPTPDRYRVDAPKSLSAKRAGDGPSIAIGHPRGVKAEACARGGAYAFARDHTEHQRAGRQAIPVNDYTFARCSHRCERVEIVANLTAAILRDPHRRGHRCRAERHHSGAEKQTPNLHFPVPVVALPQAAVRSWNRV